MGLLDRKLATQGALALYMLRDTLNCTRILSDGAFCGAETPYAIVCEKENGDAIVFPVCAQHLPSWAKSACEPQDVVDVARRGDANNRASGKRNSGATKSAKGVRASANKQAK